MAPAPAPTPSRRPSVDALARHHRKLADLMLREARRRRRHDSLDDHLEVVASAWVKLVAHCDANPEMVSMAALVRAARSAVRQAVRDHGAYRAQLPIRGWQAYVALLRVHYAGGPWVDRPNPEELAWVCNNDGSQEDIEARVRQGRSIDLETAQLVLWGRRQVDTELTLQADPSEYARPEAATLALDLIQCLDGFIPSARGATRDLAVALRCDIECSLHGDVPPTPLRAIADRLGMAPTTADRAVTSLRAALAPGRAA